MTKEQMVTVIQDEALLGIIYCIAVMIVLFAIGAFTSHIINKSTAGTEQNLIRYVPLLIAVGCVFITSLIMYNALCEYIHPEAYLHKLTIVRPL